MYARVISIAVLPVSGRNASLTSVRLHKQDEETAVFFENNPLASVLKAGEWIEYNEVDQYYGENIRFTPEAILKFSCVYSQRDFVSAVRELDAELTKLHLPAGLRPSHSLSEVEEDAKSADEFIRKLRWFRQAFGLGLNPSRRVLNELPDELVMRSMHPQLREHANLLVLNAVH
jgi:hypothetical protein